jgi:hypothetical protein
MTRIRKVDVPGGSLLAAYAGAEETYVDCYAACVPQPVSLHRLVTALFGSWAFLPEKLILSGILRQRIDIEEAEDMARGRRDHFAVWEVEARSEGELLLCDMTERTRTWFCVSAEGTGTQGGTALFFGSAVVPGPDGTQSSVFKGLTPLHKVYARLLLRGALGNL